MAVSRLQIEQEMDGRITALGFELVSLEWAGSHSRPIVRIRVDKPDSSQGVSVTVNDCVYVSRTLEAWLDQYEEAFDSYVLEVSSPGIERPLVRPCDWERFAGQRVVVKGHKALTKQSARLEAELLGLDYEPEPTAYLRLEDGTEMGVPLSDIKGAHLMFNWE